MFIEFLLGIFTTLLVSFLGSFILPNIFAKLFFWIMSFVPDSIKRDKISDYVALQSFKFGYIIGKHEEVNRCMLESLEQIKLETEIYEKCLNKKYGIGGDDNV